MKFTRSLRQAILLFLISCLLAVAVPPAVAQMQSPQGVQLVRQARTLYAAERFAEAVPLLQQAAAQFEAKGQNLDRATALSNLAATYGQLALWEPAEQAVNSSLSVVRAQPKTPEQQRIWAEILNIQGQIKLERGQTPDAIDIWTQAAKIFEQIDSKKQLVQVQINQSRAWETLGLYPRACKILLGSLNLENKTCEVLPAGLASLKNQSFSSENIRVINALGRVLRVLGQLERSNELLLTGLEAARNLGLRQEEAAIYLNLGNTQRAKSNKPGLKTPQRADLERSALEYYARSAEGMPEKSTIGMQAKLNQLSMLADSQNASEAKVLWRSLEPQVAQFTSNRAGLYAQINLAQTLIKLDKLLIGTPGLSDIDRMLSLAVESANRLGDKRIQAYILGARGKVYELKQQYSVAETLTVEALSLAPAFQSPDIAYQLLWQLGRIRKAQGNTEGAIAQYTQAVNVLSSLRGDLVTVNPEVQFSFRESAEPVYRELVGLLLQDESPSQDKLKLARQTVESLQLAELDNFFRDACADAKPKSIEEIDPAAAVIYPIILSDRLEVILSIPGKPLRRYTTKKSQAELETAFRVAKNTIRPSAFVRDRFPPIQQVYDWLIRPAEADLTASGIKTLVFVLDGYLRNLPMGVLHDGEKFLVEKYSIALAPGLQLLAPKPLSQVKLKVLTGGLSESRQGFSALPGVKQELEQISAQMPASGLLNQDFVSAQLHDRIKALSYPIVHLATHGQFSSNAADTFIVTWDQKVNVKEFDRLLRSRTGEKQQPIELLVLSACETASGDNRAALGLAGAAIRSGARSTVATLWQVNDESTAIFMTEFYRQLAASKASKAEALRNAQLSLLQNPDYQNPYFWAPFVLVGNWQ
ncbi:MAG: CHAT domain-containing protein [Microcoleus sp. PH2017_10_PVI_O_A]|uniref:CHAT domain-containing protein n=1 Tax=unclassified Microcoleus TaxID=2642155 RepID=UPI001DDFCDC3|nr:MULTISPECIES: CHAT domain-containing protein [unclassified Microcoleus]TAE82803.1 MAG: CHAT domain-containing protein [Oscillatoriales cyanobacterium]MCC3406599.1 CHAT domain-containing protein [Microcoleus sp. PH2017_10_PVI_O_A]MCC3460611.1 CHAT domain-containing protein [Microcoleus sp. PH2017_11_PCY_U_A]MCC3479158.1 CHAT domain-containing protein [Microcoleus sp. PH2017_12_PCY_D_A]MCC3526564.1 CHAT domain-containing protein [Microcoleus sp. PH2017_21_RUC_O_A]